MPVLRTRDQGDSPVVSAYLPNPRPFGGHPTLLNGLTHYWRFDEVSAGAAPVSRLDSVGSIAWTDINTTASAAGLFGNALDMVSADATSLQQVVGPDLRIPAWTHSIWIYPTVTMQSRGVWAINHGGGDGAKVICTADAHPNTRVTHAYTNVIGSNATTANFIVLNSWNLILAWWDGTDNWVQLNNGVPVSSTAFAQIDGVFGSASVGLVPLMDGQVDENGFWVRTLTAGERSDLWNGGAGLRL